MELFSQAICIAQEIGSLDFVARIAVNIGSLLFQQGKKENAQNWLFAAISHSAIEFDHKQKAIHLLEENLIEFDLPQNDERLESIAALFCHKK